ncbi:MAG: hemolysin family protein [Treponema sp.]|nr:hemolysin family protein [Treponema sp.]
MDHLLPVLVLLALGAVIISGVFTLFISAVVLSRKSRLEKEQSKKYKSVLKILDNPNKILLACRIWRIIFWVLASFCVVIFWAFSSLFTQKMYFWIMLALELFILCLIIALIGEGLPKLLSHTKPEKAAAFLLPVMKILSIPLLPFVLPALKFASFFNKTVHPEIDGSAITEEELQNELRNTLIEGEKSGVVESRERDMVEGVFYLGDRSVGAFMTHRSEIQWLDINLPYEEINAKVIEHREQRCFPVVNANPDEIIGAVYLEDIIIDCGQEKPLGLRSIMKKAQFVPETMPAIKAFESFKHGQSNFLFVMDEYGGLSGIISITALVEEIVGELSTPVVNEEPLLKQEDGTWLADGTLNIDDAAKGLSITISEEGDFHTLAGLVLHIAGELPKVGDSFEYQGYKFKVVDKDGNRIDKLLIKKID